MKKYLQVLTILCATFLGGVCCGAVWMYTAVSRTLAEHYKLLESYHVALEGCTLNFTKSFFPVLKRPWRSDIRLYYVRAGLASSSHTQDIAWAVREESGKWYFKRFQ